MLWVVGFLELMTGAAIFEQAKGSGRESGDFSFDPLGLQGTNAAQKLSMKEKEIKNGKKNYLISLLIFINTIIKEFLFKYFKYIFDILGRLAMLAFAGIVTQNALHPDIPFPYLN